ncbi:MAG: HDOD domain-containing protein [Rhodocyclaceae bacterium]
MPATDDPRLRTSAAPRPEPASAAEWVARIREEEMPALGATVAMVRSVTADEKASTAKLAQSILQDAAMTAKVLKLANSAFYNPARQNISTISRAIVVLGLNVVAEMAIGIRLVDALVSGGVRQRVVEDMARGFHSAVLARSLARLRRDARSEEVFIAALLSRVGEMAFWAFGGTVAERLDTTLRSGGLTFDEAQQVVLGFKLRQISLGLAREWKLGPLLLSVLEGGRNPAPTEQAIHYAHRLAQELRHGWHAPDVKVLVDELAEFAAISPEEMQSELVAGTEEAARIAQCFGAIDAAKCIPAGIGVVPVDDGDALAGPDPVLQLRILRELSTSIAAGAPLNDILTLVLEGLFRGVGFDRVLFAMLTPNRQQLVGKAGLGSGVESLRQRFIFSIGSEPGDLFHEFFAHPAAMRIESGRALSPDGLLRAERLTLVTNATEACVAPIELRGHAVGLFYADRCSRGQALDGETFEAFQLFAQQVSIAANRLGVGRRA